MGYSKVEIGKGLKVELNKGYNISRISSWADKIFFSVRGQRSPDLDNILETIMIMDAGPEFVYTEDELKIIAEKLINDENPFE